jgi:putative membrane protein insertion efficiency factor
MLHAYKHLLSPLFPVACRYTPTCSEYAAEAIARHGTLRGAGLALGRLLRCRPLAGAGYDPVPQSGKLFSQREPLSSAALRPTER